jgi:hypothetical protein
LKKKRLFFVGILKDTEGKSRVRIRYSLVPCGSEDPDPYQNVTDLEHWKEEREVPTWVAI